MITLQWEMNNKNIVHLSVFRKFDTCCITCRFSDCVESLKPGTVLWGLVGGGGAYREISPIKLYWVLPQYAGMLLKAHQRDVWDRPLCDHRYTADKEAPNWLWIYWVHCTRALKHQRWDSRRHFQTNIFKYCYSSVSPWNLFSWKTSVQYSL